jgi:hypothetical protein
MFADLEPTDDAFLQFANQFGGLGVGVLLRGESRNGQIEMVLGNVRAEGEPRWRWRYEHQQMRAVSAMLSAIQNEDIALLKEHFTLAEHGVRYDSRDGGFEWVCSTQMQLKEWLWKWGLEAQSDEERMLRFASGWAQTRINDAMSGRGAERQSLTSVRLLFNHERQGIRLHITPDTLLGAMWLQCARVLSENPTFKVCENCAKWFELSPDARRKHSKYCSDRCKVAAHRAKKKARSAGDGGLTA